MTSPLFKSPIPLNYLDTDTALTANSDVKVATQKAVKAYVASQVPTALSKATGAEVDTGTDDAKYVTPKAMEDSAYAKTTAIPVKASQEEIATGTDDAKFATALSLSKFHIPPEGFLYNGKIVPSVASNNLTVAIKGLDGNDPSATNPVYVRIGDTVRSITSALSVTKNAGTNWCNAGSAELATKEVDYFVYIGYNATDGVVIGFSRIPWAKIYSGFSATSTAETYCAISTITNASAGDNYVIVGRFGATLSAGAGYTWTVPTFTTINLIQRPIFNTRTLQWLPTMGGFTATFTQDCRYRVMGGLIYVLIHRSTGATSNANTLTMTMPFASANNGVNTKAPLRGIDNGTVLTTPSMLDASPNTSTFAVAKDWAGNVWTTSGSKGIEGNFIYIASENE